MSDGRTNHDKRKRFAQQQIQFLKDQGVEDRRQRSRIFKAAGPGQVQEAWRLATCEDWSTDAGRVRKDLLDCILTGVAGSQDFDGIRQKAVLAECGFYVPDIDSDSRLFRILDGALEILVPGAYEFTEDELQDIERGLRKRVADEHVSD